MLGFSVFSLSLPPTVDWAIAKPALCLKMWCHEIFDLRVPSHWGMPATLRLRTIWCGRIHRAECLVEYSIAPSKTGIPIPMCLVCLLVPLRGGRRLGVHMGSSPPSIYKFQFSAILVVKSRYECIGAPDSLCCDGFCHVKAVNCLSGLG